MFCIGILSPPTTRNVSFLFFAPLSTAKHLFWGYTTSTATHNNIFLTTSHNHMCLSIVPTFFGAELLTVCEWNAVCSTFSLPLFCVHSPYNVAILPILYSCPKWPEFYCSRELPFRLGGELENVANGWRCWKKENRRLKGNSEKKFAVRKVFNRR